MSNDAASPRPSTPPASRLGTFERQLVGEEDQFLRAHTRLNVLTLRGGYGTVVLEAPGFTTRDEVAEYASRLFGREGYKVTEQPIGGAYRVIMPVYGFKQAIDAVRKPVGYRALPEQSKDVRAAIENEFRFMMGLDARPPERDMEAMIQDLGLAKALAELGRDYRLMFSDTLKDGVYALPVKEPASVIARGAEALIGSGTFSPADAFFTGEGAGRQLHITPAALLLLEEALLKGIRGKDTTVPSVLSPEAAHTRDAYFGGLRLDEVRRDLAEAQLARMDASQRNSVKALLNGKDAATLLGTRGGDIRAERLGVEVMSRAIESVAMKHEAAPAEPYDTQALRRAIASGRAMLAEPRFWKSLENAQLASHHNAIRLDHDEALADLDALLAAQPVSQAGIHTLLTLPRFAAAIRDTGHFLSIVQDAKTQGYDNGADRYQQAFHLTRAALEPQSAEAKSASYYIRSEIGKTGFGETVGRNFLLGLRPIISSVDLMVKKPMLVGAAILGIAGYSAAVPSRYKPATLIHDFMDYVMTSMGISHSHDSKAAKAMDALKDKVGVDKAKAVADGKGSHFKNGYRAGVATTAGTAAAAFVAFNVVEDIVVHLPLAIGGVGVGAVGGLTGRKVFSPVLNDIGDIAGRFSPEPVRQAFRADKALVSQAMEGSWVGRAGRNIRQFTHDLDEFGIVATGHHLVSGTKQNVATLFHRVMGNEPGIARG